jgi:transposase
VDEIERAGMRPQLVQAGKAKLMMGQTNKTDKLDARGLNRLQRNGTLPTVWIPEGALRDKRDLPRTRMVLVSHRTQLKNRILATFGKYGINLNEMSDPYGVKGQDLMREQLTKLPENTRYATKLMLEELDMVQSQVERIDSRIEMVFESTPELEWIMSLPGVGKVLGVVILSEVGSIERFPRAGQLASYAGTTPRVHSSGGRVWMGSLRHDVNRYLKWAYVEAANVVSIHRGHWPQRSVVQLYNRVKAKKGHGTAIGAVARHLAESTFWVLKKKEMYKEPQQRAVLSRANQRVGILN